MSVAPGKPGYFGKGSVEVGPKAEPGQTRARRITIAENALSTQPLEGIDTVYDILAYSSRTHASRNAAGARDIVGVHEEEKEIKKVVDGKETIQKKKWQFFELSEFKYITYTQLKEQSDAIGKGLADIGLKKGDIFNIYAGTRWVFSAIIFEPWLTRSAIVSTGRSLLLPAPQSLLRSLPRTTLLGSLGLLIH